MINRGWRETLHLKIFADVREYCLFAGIINLIIQIISGRFTILGTHCEAARGRRKMKEYRRESE